MKGLEKVLFEKYFNELCGSLELSKIYKVKPKTITHHILAYKKANPGWKKQIKHPVYLRALREWVGGNKLPSDILKDYIANKDKRTVASTWRIVVSVLKDVYGVTDAKIKEAQRSKIAVRNERYHKLHPHLYSKINNDFANLRMDNRAALFDTLTDVKHLSFEDAAKVIEDIERRNMNE